MPSLIASLPGNGSVPEVVILLLAVLWLCALVHCLASKRLNRIEKIVWVIALLVLSVLAAVGYWIVRLVSREKPMAAQGPPASLRT